jgi:hypothetical protein
MLILPGDYRERATPVPISNTAVKPLIADGTALVTMWESRTLPGLALYNLNKTHAFAWVLLFIRLLILKHNSFMTDLRLHTNLFVKQINEKLQKNIYIKVEGGIRHDSPEELAFEPCTWYFIIL